MFYNIRFALSISFIAAGSLLSIASPAFAQKANSGEPFTVTETRMGMAPLEVLSPKGGGLFLSRDNLHFAYIEPCSGNEFGTKDAYRVVVDGKQEAAYKGIRGSVEFSSDYKRHAYLAERSDGYVVVVDGKEQKPQKGVGARQFEFSQDGKRWAYLLTRPNGKRVQVVDGVEGSECDDAGYVSFSPDSKRFYYNYGIDKQRFLMLDEKVFGPYESLSRDSWSVDSKHWCFLAKRPDGWHVVLDGKEGVANAEIAKGDYRDVVEMSPNGGVVAYVSKKGSETLFNLSDNVNFFSSKADNAITRLFWSGDSQRIGLVVGKDQAISITQMNSATTKYPTVPPLKAYPKVLADTFEFSPDSLRFGYIAMTEVAPKDLPEMNRFVAVVDGVETPSFLNQKEKFGRTYGFYPFLKFSPDSKRYAYGAMTETNQVHVIENGVEGPLFDVDGFAFSGDFLYSPDGKSFAYRGIVNKRPVLVVNGKVVTANLQGYLPTGLLIWTSNSLLTSVGYRGSEVIRVSVSIR